MKLDLDDDAVNKIAFECEKIAHGTPSGVDNSIATFATPMLFNNESGLTIEKLDLKSPPPVVIAFSSQSGSTLEQVSAVRARYEAQPERYAGIFAEVDALGLSAADALRSGDYEQVGHLMNIGHGLLNAIGVSTPELESMLSIARAAGASGAKLTGSGGGGSVVVMCPGAEESVALAFAAAGYETLSLKDREIG
jgi:hydroxymethylglutaryl-CoA reductase